MARGHAERTDWEAVYGASATSGGWSYLSRIILRALGAEIGTVDGLSVLEAGSGSGVNSLGLWREGARVTLLDVSAHALARSREMFRLGSAVGGFTRGSMFEMPFRDRSFDVVWNAGVVEHWIGEEQADCVREMRRVCKRNGVVVMLNPYAGSRLHAAGKRVLEKAGRYDFTDETPVVSMAQAVRAAGGELARREYSVGFFVLFVGALRYLSAFRWGGPSRVLFRVANSVFASLDDSVLGAPLSRLDRLLCRVFGGYLLVSVSLKKEP